MSDTGIGHDVSLEIPGGMEVGKRDLKIRVWSDGIRFGTLTSSKGAIDWSSGHAKGGKSGHIQLAWAGFFCVIHGAAFSETSTPQPPES